MTNQIIQRLGWLQNLPADWESKRLRFMLDRNDGGAWGSDPDGSDDVVVLRSTEQTVDGKWAITDPALRSLSKAEHEATCLFEGDLLVTKSSGSETHIGKTTIVDAEIAALRAGYSNFMQRLRANDNTHPRFVWYLLNSPHAKIQLNLESTTSTGLANLNGGLLGRLVFPSPPLREQVAIALFLDAETAQIDELIKDKWQLLDLLHEFRGGVIRERTAGLNLACARGSTGNQFMPTLPVGWQLVGIGRYATITNGSTPLKDNSAFWDGGTYPWLNSAVVNDDEVTEGSEMVTAEALRLCHLPIVPAGSVLVALTGQGRTRGQATVLRIEATINQHLAAIICDCDHLDGEFLFWVLSGQYAALRMVSDGQGGTKGALTCDELGRFPIPKPPIDVQRAIAKSLYEETRKIDRLIEHVRSEVVMLQELRSATITDAVLGRIDVREYMKTE